MDSTIQTLIQRDANGNREVYGSGSVRVSEAGSKSLTTVGIGVSPLGVMSTAPGTVNIVEERDATLHRTVITLTNVVVPTTDGTTNGSQGNLPAYTFPRGLIEFLGAVLNLTIVGDGTGVISTAAVVGALGTVAAANDATLTSTEANLAPSYAGTLAAGAGVIKSKGVTSTFFDNTTFTNATQLAALLNFAMPDASSTANGTITVSGTITMNWFNHGDN